MTSRKKRQSRTINVDYLARVEGEGALTVHMRGDEITDVKFRIFEPPRFFEAFLRGRAFSEAPDITARVCGICPVAYQMSACHAMEQAFGIQLTGPLRDLRRLLYCGEWIQSHVLHIYMLHAPDFLGYQDVIELAADHPETVQLCLRLKKVGNAIMTLLGGREVHPINVTVGGFYHIPPRHAWAPLVEELKWARDAVLETVRWSGTLDFPDLAPDYEFVALAHPDEYPFNEGRLRSNRGLDVPIDEFNAHFAEEHVAHSNALQAVHRGFGPYHVGPLARFNLNFDLLSPVARQAALAAGAQPPVVNPFKSIIVRSVEVLHSIEEALRILEDYVEPDQPALSFEPRAGVGHGCTEAPRGILYHRYELDEKGTILDAQIVPPTSQNQRQIEADLADLVRANLHLDQEALTWRCEQAIRNYDPCISCATHFLKLEFRHES